MQKRNLVSLAVLLAVAFLGLGCRNHLLSQPTFESPKTVGGGVSGGHQASGSAVSFGAPANLVSTQGHYREITLSWEPVWNSARYYIYRADTQFDTFVQVGETADAATSYTTKVGAGADYYYRIAAVSANGKVSPFSEIVRGTSLAEPIVSAIEGVAGKEDEEVVVYWYMGNVSAYQQQVRYHVVCEDPTGKEIARVVVDGSKHSKTEAVITGLNPNKDYKYKVEAYHVSAQDKVEASQPIDAATARRLRPDAPVELRVDQGLSVQEINLSFKLPSLVDVALPGGLYDQKPLYFKIYRRERREGVTDTEQGWQLLKADFGKTETQPGEGEVQKVNFGDGDVEYTPGSIVTFTDKTAGLKRGVQYEYKVQSFSYTPDREITSNFSYSIETGWLLAPATFSTGTYTAVKNAEGTANVSASLSFQLDWDDMGLAGQYHFILEETRDALEKDGATPGSPRTLDTIDTKEELHSYIRKFKDLSRQEDRGYYHYSLGIYLDGNPTPIETLESLGRAIVTDSVNLPVIKLFSATTGYQDKIELSWQYKDTEEYRLAYSDGSGAISYIEHDQLVAGFRDADTLTYEHRVGAGKDNSYILSVTNDEGTVDTPVLPGSSSQAPVPRAKGLAYDSIEVEWDDVPAQEFTVSARYDDSSLASSHAIDPQKVTGSADGHSPTPRSVAFVQPSGYDDARVSGKPLTVTVEATVPVKRNILELSGETGTSYHQRTEDVSTQTISGSVSTRTMGPALVNAEATQGGSETEIQVSWKKIDGAKAYAVIRTQHHISPESSGDSVKIEPVAGGTDTYLVDVSSDTPKVSLRAGIVPDQDEYFTVSASADGSGFTLTDRLSTDTVADPTIAGWHRSQSQLSWGAPYKYIVLPLLDTADLPDYDVGEEAVATIGDTRLTNVQNTVGATRGYGWHVKATKGTHSEDGENTGVKLTWVRPYAGIKSTELYTVYRKAAGDSSWTRLTTIDSKPEYIDDTAQPGVVYDYMVAPSTTNTNGQGAPYNNSAYVAFCDTLKDEQTAKHLAKGFMLPKPIISKVTRENVGTERVQVFWPAVAIGGVANDMIEGYVIEMLNRNLDNATWQNVFEWSFSSGLKKLPQYDVSIKNDNDRLLVKTEYKIYFRMRAYTLDENGDRVYSKAPADTFTDELNREVVWGARALTHEEFLWCAGEVMRQGISDAASGWDTQNFGPYNTNNVWSKSSFGVGIWVFVFDNYKRNFMTMQGRLGAETAGTNQLPRYYFNNMTGVVNGTDKTSTGLFSDYSFLREDPGTSTPYSTLTAGDDITVVGPSDVNGMYNGNIQFIDVGTTGGGRIEVTVNGTTTTLSGGFKKYTTLPGA